MPGSHIQVWDGKPEDHPLRNLQKLSKHLFSREDQDAIYLLLNAISDCVLLLSADSQILYANQAANHLLGYKRDELLGRNIVELFSPDQTSPDFLQYLFRGEIFASDRFVLRHARGFDVQLLVTAIPVGEPEQVEGAILVVRDISIGLLTNLALNDREHLIEGVFESIAAGVILQSETGNVLRINKQAVQFLGLETNEILGRELTSDVLQIMDPDGTPLVNQESLLQQALRANGQTIENIVYTKFSEQPYLCSARSFRTDPAAGKYSRLVLTTLTDITTSQQSNTTLQTSLQMQQTMNRILTGLLTEQGPDHTIQNALAGVLKIIDAKEVLLFYLEDNVWSISHTQTIPHRKPKSNDRAVSNQSEIPAHDLDQDLHQKLNNIKEIQILSSKDLGFDQNANYTAMHFLVAPLTGDNHRALVAAARPASQAFSQHEMDRLQSALPILNAALFKASYEKQLTLLAVTDSLTGLSNRRHIFQQLEHEIERAERYKHKLSALVLDLDYFKEINDTHGHQAGDAVLKVVARTMKLLMRSSDQLGRIGGEEFMILLPEADLAGACIAAEKLRQSIDALRIQYEDQKLETSVSIGCGVHQPGEEMAVFYNRLDKLLYQAKQAGRNYVAS